MADQAAEFRRSAPADRQAADSARSLVPVSASNQRDVALPRLRTSATFLAHLIATAQQAPQTRTRRQAEPGEASARYAATAARPRRRRGCILPSL